MMRILYVTTVGITMRFFRPFIQELLKEGHTVDIATNERESSVPDCYREWGCRVYSIPCSRSPFNKGNLDAIKEIRNIVTEGKYEIVHCHTPVAALCTRVACKNLRRSGLKVVYTAHGFHFYRGAPVKNWLIYYPLEKLASFWTDVLITINKEDFALAQRKMRAASVVYVPGVGIDMKKFDISGITPQQISQKKQELNINPDEKVLLSVGELITRKNHESVIKALTMLPDRNWKYFICGNGELEDYLRQKIDAAGLSDHVFLLGFRHDIAEIFACTDLFVFPSFQEGLPVALMEAIAMQVPVISSRIRGSDELVPQEFTFSPTDAGTIAQLIRDVLSSDQAQVIERNYENLKNFELSVVNDQMKKIYTNLCEVPQLLCTH